jgi:CheY-like chemotaxis protein
VIEAVSADQGLRLMRSDRPDVVLLDVILPGQSGWSLLETMKRSPELASFPVVVVSVHDDRQHSLSLGAVEHVCKPFLAADLMTAVGRCLGSPEMTGDASRPSPTLVSS